jgi:hypothetical protein
MSKRVLVAYGIKLRANAEIAAGFPSATRLGRGSINAPAGAKQHRPNYRPAVGWQIDRLGVAGAQRDRTRPDPGTVVLQEPMSPTTRLAAMGRAQGRPSRGSSAVNSQGRVGGATWNLR